MSDREIRELYFRWLLEKVGINPYDTDYGYVLRKMFNMDFYSLVANDDNRAVDGSELRIHFLEETKVCSLEEGIDILQSCCSILEMMIALAIRCESEIMYDPNKGNRTALWFDIFFNNLGLNNYPDSFLDEEMVKNVNHILTNLVERTYQKNGKGGLFPLKQPAKDQRRVEIWYQMAAYLNENYDF